MTDTVRVPREPTPEMLNAAVDVDAFKLGDISPLGFRISPQMLFERVWSAMLAASPQGEGSSAEAEPVPRYELHPTGSGGSSDVLTYRVTEGVKP